MKQEKDFYNLKETLFLFSLVSILVLYAYILIILLI